MFTTKDIELKTVYVINCIDKRNLRVSNGELLLEESDTSKTLTKLPFQKILAIFIIGDITITTPLLDKCKKFNISIIVTKRSLRPVFFWSNIAEANVLLRQKQHKYNQMDISIAKLLVKNKIKNQLSLLNKTRKKDTLTINGSKTCTEALATINDITEYNALMGVEGYVSKIFFKAYFNDFNWSGRKPRTKCDIMNTTLDIGYTIMFNFIECFLRIFGFDLYVGVYHRLWFKRKSLVCDIIEPFRCIIDKTVRTAYNRKQFSPKDFVAIKGEYHLTREKTSDYYKVFYDAIIPYKKDIFQYTQTYYRYFMQNTKSNKQPEFSI